MDSLSNANPTDSLDVSVSDSDGELVKNAKLFLAIREGSIQEIVQLLDSGVKVNIIDRNNQDNTPLHCAIVKGNKEIVEELLLPKWTTDINAKNNKGYTPLHIAIRKGDKELVQLLLSKLLAKIKDDTEYGPLALKILDMISYFSPNIIPLDIFFKLEKDNNEKVRKAVELLNQYSLIKLEHGKLDVHSLVQEVTRLNLEVTKKQVLKEALKLLQDGKSKIDLLSCNLRLSNVDHAVSVWSYAKKHIDLVEDFNSLPVLIVSELAATLRYEDACLFMDDTLKLLKRTLNGVDISLPSMMKIVAFVFYTQGKYEDALKIYRELKEKSDFNGYLVPQKIFFECHVGLEINRQGKDDESLDIFSNLHRLVKEKKINSDGTTEHYLACNLFNTNKFDDAIKMFENALKLTKNKLGPNHESTLKAEHMIVLVLKKQGKYDEALEKCKEVQAKRKRILGLNHLDTLTSDINIVELYLKKRMKHNEALGIANKVEKRAAKSNLWFNHHPIKLEAKYLKVEILDAQCKYDEALTECKKVYIERKRMFGSNNPDTLTTLNKWYALALRFEEQGEYIKAIKEFNNVLKERTNILPPNHPDILLTWDAIGKAYQAQNRDSDINFIPKLFFDSQRAQITDIRYTVLHFAAQNGYVTFVEKLLEEGDNVDGKTIDGSTPLHLAAFKNHLDVVNALLKGDADVDCRNNKGFGPLHIASQEGHTKIVELLLKNNADIEATNNEDLTPLHIAAYCKHLDVVKVLLEGGANIDAVNELNKTPSQITNYESIKKVLLSTKQLFNKIRQEHNQSDIQRLLQDGAVINYFSNSNRKTSLHYAVSKGNLSIVRLLLRKQPNVNIADEKGRTPLHYVAQDCRAEIMKLLLDHGADPSSQDRDEKIPLQLAGERLKKKPEIYQKIKDILKQHENLGLPPKRHLSQEGEISDKECSPTTSKIAKVQPNILRLTD